MKDFFIMKNHARKIATVFLALIMCVGIIPASTLLALGDDEATDESVISSYGQGLLEATEEEMAQWAGYVKKSEYNRTEEEALSSTVQVSSSSSASWIYTSRNFYYYAQQKSYSCGAACVRMALRNITGINYSEATVRAGCNTTTSGTSLANMVTYINTMQDYNEYAPCYQATKSFMTECLYDGITYWDSPPLVGVKETTDCGWNYNLSAHCVIIFAVKSDESSFRVTDPWPGYIGDTAFRDVTITVDNMYTSYSAINGGFMF